MEWSSRVHAQMLRRKPVPKDVFSTPLKRCLTSLDLTMAALGTMLGASVYTLAGEVARLYAGPAVFISFLMAAILCALNMVCYAEFGTKLPKVGAFYEFSYAIYGEFVAFIAGWCGIFQASLSAAYVARIWSGAVDILFDKKIENSTMMLLDDITMGHYPDFLGVGIVIIGTFVVILGPQTYSLLNVILTTTTLFCITVITCLGFSQMNISNWTNYASFPFGIWGIINGSTRCFFGFLGFASIFSLSEEAINPIKSVTTSLITVCSVTTIFYVLSSISLTLMVPYTDLDITAPFSQALISVGMTPIAYVVSIGTIISSTSSINASINIVSRYIYAMSADGLLPPNLSTVNFHTRTPATATVWSGTLIALLTLLLDIETLLQFIIMDSLFFFMLLAAAVLVMRYAQPENCPFPIEQSSINKVLIDDISSQSELSNLTSQTRQNLSEIGQLKHSFSKNALLLHLIKLCRPLHLPNVCIFFLCFCSFSLGLFTNVVQSFVISGNWFAVAVLCTVCGIFLFSIIILATFQENNSLSNIQTPFLPYLPAVCIVINAILFCHFPLISFLRFTTWAFTGLIAYFAYGYRHSELRVDDNKANCDK